MSAEPPCIGIVLLAAGMGRRFGPSPKLLAELDGKPLVRWAAEAAVSSRASPIVAVLGGHAAAIRVALDKLDLRIVENAKPAAGLSTSLRVGLAALIEADAAIVLLADMPWIAPRHIDGLIDAYSAAAHRPAAVVPIHAGRRGNPVLLDLRHLAGPLTSLDGDRGAGLLLAARDDVLEVPMDDAILRDVDTPGAFTGR